MKKHPIIWLTSLALMLLVASVASVHSFSSNPRPHAAVRHRREGAMAVAVQAAEQGNPWINLLDGRQLMTEYTGPPGLQQALTQHLATPTALAAADFDGDSAPDLVSGYVGPHGGLLTLHRGNKEALSPSRPETRRAIAQGQFPPPFHPTAQVMETPEAPEFLATGDVTRDGHQDVVMAARGSDGFYVMAGDGRGQLQPAQRVDVPGAITALVTGQINEPLGRVAVAVGVVGDDGPQVLVVHVAQTSACAPLTTPQAQTSVCATVEAMAMPGEAVALLPGQLDEDGWPDLAVVTPEAVVILHGSAQRAASSQAESRPDLVETIPLSVRVVAATGGDFVRDGARRMDIAVLAEDETIHLLRQPASVRGTRRGAPAAAESETATASVRGTRRGAPAAVEREPATGWPQRATRTKQWSSHVIAADLRPSATRLVRAHVSSLPTDDLIVLDQSNHQLHILTTSDEPRTKDQGPRTPTTLDVEGAPVAVLPMRLTFQAQPGLVILSHGHTAPAAAMPAAAVYYKVTSTADNTNTTPSGGSGTMADPYLMSSLRGAIRAANANAGADTILFDTTFNGSAITLTIAGTFEDFAATGDLDITESVTLMGNGASNTIIDGGSLDRVFDSWKSGAMVMFMGVTIQGANVTNDGGGLYNSGQVTIDSSTVSGNTAVSGGGIINISTGQATIDNSTVSSNTAMAGGGIRNSGTMLIQNNSTIGGTSGNTAVSGGGLYNSGGDVTIDNSTISGNMADVGGGIFNSGGTVLIQNSSTIGGANGNTASTFGGGIHNVNNGHVTIDNSTVSNNSGPPSDDGLRNDSAATFTAQGTVNFNGGDSILLVDGTFTSTSGTLNLTGHFTHSGGSFVHNGGTVVCNGTSSQTLDGAGATTFNKLTINNAAGVTLGSNKAVNGTLTLTSGDLMTGSNVLIMGTGAASAGTTDVVGTVRRTDLGATARAFGNPFNTITINSGTAPTQLDVTLAKSAPASFTNGVQRTYTLTPTGGSGIMATVRLHYLDGELNGNTEAALELFRFDSGMNKWLQVGPKTGSSTTDNWVETSGVTTFSDWTLSSVSPTAVAVSAFTARASVSAVVVEWETASEADIAGFNVLRSSDGGNSYAMLNPALMPAQSSGSPSGAQYEFRDATASGPGRYWYVLEVVTLDGARRRTDPVSVAIKRLSMTADR